MRSPADRCRKCQEVPPRCHVCPECLDPDGAAQVMPACSGAAVFGAEACHCEGDPLGINDLDDDELEELPSYADDTPPGGWGIRGLVR